jgi:hypothetical protein
MNDSSAGKVPVAQTAAHCPTICSPFFRTDEEPLTRGMKEENVKILDRPDLLRGLGLHSHHSDTDIDSEASTYCHSFDEEQCKRHLPLSSPMLFDAQELSPTIATTDEEEHDNDGPSITPKDISKEQKQATDGHRLIIADAPVAALLPLYLHGAEEPSCPETIHHHEVDGVEIPHKESQGSKEGIRDNQEDQDQDLDYFAHVDHLRRVDFKYRRKYGAMVHLGDEDQSNDELSELEDGGGEAEVEAFPLHKEDEPDYLPDGQDLLDIEGDPGPGPSTLPPTTAASCTRTIAAPPMAITSRPPSRRRPPSARIVLLEARRQWKANVLRQKKLGRTTKRQRRRLLHQTSNSSSCSSSEFDDSAAHRHQDNSSPSDSDDPTGGSNKMRTAISADSA